MIFHHVISILRWTWQAQLDCPLAFTIPPLSYMFLGRAQSGRLRYGLRSALLILVVATPPGARFIAPFGRAVEPLVHAPKAVQSAPIGGVGVVDDTVLDRERAQARPLARVRGHVGSAHSRVQSRSLADA